MLLNIVSGRCDVSCKQVMSSKQMVQQHVCAADLHAWKQCQQVCTTQAVPPQLVLAPQHHLMCQSGWCDGGAVTKW